MSALSGTPAPGDPPAYPPATEAAGGVSPAGGTARRQFQTLDGLRGVAAVAVVVLHAGGFFNPVATPSAYLAVDLFFVLSGFVLAHAYAERFAQGMTLSAFMLRRWIRLYPLYLVGTLIGIASALVAWKLHAGEYSLRGVTLASVAGVLMAPSPTWNERSILYGVNTPAWSLFLELLANIAYGAFARHLTVKRLVVVVAVSGVLLCASVWAFGSADLGSTWGTLAPALPRVTFSFFAGVLIFKLHSGRERITLFALLLPLTLLVVFAAAPAGRLRAGFDVLCVLVAFPAIVAAAATIEPRPGLGARTLTFLGVTSYAVYVLHYPLWELARRALRAAHLDPVRFAPELGVVFVAAVLVAAWTADLVLDVPVRRWLSRRLLP